MSNDSILKCRVLNLIQQCYCQSLQKPACCYESQIKTTSQKRACCYESQIKTTSQINHFMLSVYQIIKTIYAVVRRTTFNVQLTSFQSVGGNPVSSYMAKQAGFPRRLEKAENVFGVLTVILPPSLHSYLIQSRPIYSVEQLCKIGT